MKRYKKILAEMAFTRPEILKDVKSLQKTINYHLIKLLLFSGVVDEKKWKKEISDKLDEIQIQKWTVNKKYLPPSDYYTFLYSKPLDLPDNKNKGDRDIYELYIKKAIEENIDYKSKYDEYSFPFITWNKKIVNFYIEVTNTLGKGLLTKNVTIYLIDKYVTNS